MTPNCEQCKHFKKNLPHKCKRTGHSCLWERASKIPMLKLVNGRGWSDVEPIRDNCGLEGQFFEARQ